MNDYQRFIYFSGNSPAESVKLHLDAIMVNTAGKSHKCEPQDYCFGATNEAEEFWCYSCMDSGIYEICDGSTDALIGWERCDCTAYPLWAHGFITKYASATASDCYYPDATPPF